MKASGKQKDVPQKQAIRLSEGHTNVEWLRFAQDLHVAPVCRDITLEVEEKYSVDHDIE